ncbi:MAG: hypothetical protein JNJ55_08355 [Betaproteobacteria bacterium]|nr:hypothetical protein [Betaproteobacteria bacterium]
MFVKFQLNEELGSEISSTFLSLDRQLNQLLMVSESQLSADDFVQLRRAIGDVLGIMFIDVMKNIYEQHPSLKPDSMP